jgi:hypothetical protein
MDGMKIDWEIPIERIKPYLEGKGGVLCVSGDKDSAWASFSTLLRDFLRERYPRAVNLKVNPQDEITREPSGILEKLMVKLGIDPQLRPEQGAVNVVSGIQAHHDVNVGNVNVNVYSEPRISKRTKLVLDHLDDKQDRDERFVMILHGSHEMPTKTSIWFWEHFWSGGLENFCDRGCLVVCLCESSGSCAHRENVPSVRDRVRLPSSYENNDRERAIRDMANLIVSKTGEQYETAVIRADTLLREWHHKPSTVHAGLAAWLEYE